MANITRKIGLSLGADDCWPICFEDIVRDMNLDLEMGEDRVQFDIKRVTIEPFSLRQPAKYDLVIDRLTHWYHTSREWIKKSILMDGVHVGAGAQISNTSVIGAGERVADGQIVDGERIPAPE